ncbi:MAG TPA: ferritin-like domain-containing protein [Firmicutes bacterium]|jgi:rubrerythrin|nr:ferritin-like domain-containing protein [Bacillota bacterium]
MTQWDRYFRQLAAKVDTYRWEKASAVRSYQELAFLAPTRPSRNLLLKCVEEEKRHIHLLCRLARQLTGEAAPIHPLPSLRFTSYPEGLRQRVLAESAAFLGYGEEFLNAPDFHLRKLFYQLSAVAVQHGFALTLCLNLEKPEVKG